MIAAARNPMMPISEMPLKSGGISDMTMSAEPINKAAMMMENDIRLLI